MTNITAGNIFPPPVQVHPTDSIPDMIQALTGNTTSLDETNPELTTLYHYVGGYDYIASHPFIAYPYIIIAGSASVIGSVGNLFVLGAIFSNKKLRHGRNVFLVNLALADLLVTSFGDPFSVLGMYIFLCSNIVGEGIHFFWINH